MSKKGDKKAKSQSNMAKNKFYNYAKTKSLYRKYGVVSQKDCYEIFDDVIKCIISCVADNIFDGFKLHLKNFGTLTVVERYKDKPKKLIAVNGKDKNNNFIRADNEIFIQNKKVIKFEPSKKIDSILNGKTVFDLEAFDDKTN